MTTQRLVLAGIAANTAVGSLFAWSLIAEDAARGVDIPPRGAAWVFAASIVVMAISVVATGRALVRTGPRTLLIGAAVAAGGGLVLAGTSQHPVGLFLGVAGLFGGANGVGYSVATTLASRVPARRRGTATGLVVAAYAGSPVLLGVVGPGLVADHGWRTCTLALSAVAGGLLLLAAALAPVESATERPGSTGVAEHASPRTLAWLWLAFAGGTAPALMLFAHAVALATLRGLDAGAAGLTVSALAAGNLTGRIGAGWVSDVVGRVPSLVAAVTAQAPALCAVTWGGGAGLVLGCAVLGFCYGAVSALMPAATADLVGVHAFPRSYARVFSGWGVAGLVGPVLGAGLVGLAAVTPAALMLAGLPLLAAALALWMLPRRQRPARSGGAQAAGEVGGGEDHV